MISRWGQFCFRHRWAVLAAWLAIIVGGGLAAGPVFAGMTDGDQLRHTESGDARAVVRTGPVPAEHLVALFEGGSVPLDALSTQVRAVAGVTAVETRPDALVVTLSAAGVRETSDLIRRFAAGHSGTRVSFGGDAVMEDQVNEAVQADLNGAELKSLPLTLLVLIFVFGGLIAAGLPLLATIASMAGSFGLLLVFSRFVDLDANVVTVVSMLSLALSIDYALLLVARYREELAGGHDRATAVGRTWASAGRTIAYSALTVAAALVGLLFFDVPRLRGMGAAGISAALMALFSALTLTAALIGLAGKRIKAAKRTRPATTGFFARLAGLTQRRAGLVTLGCVVLLLAAGAPLLGAHLKLPGDASLPASIEAVRVDRALGTGDRPSITVLAELPAAAMDDWARPWRTAAGVAEVQAARTVTAGVTGVTLFLTVDSQSPRAQQLVRDLRAHRPAPRSWVTGDAAMLIDLNAKIAHGLPYAGAIVLIAMFVLLFLMTGSLVVPLKALVMNVVSLGATFGVLVAVFEHGVLAGPLDTLTVGGLSPFVIVLVCAFGFGLAMDYEVFLLGRIKEGVDAGLPTDQAVRDGLQRSGRLITSAALLMLIVFGFFAYAKIGDLEQIGLGLFVAVLVDATIVRCLLVPATMTLLGRWNWWAPGILRRLHVRVGLHEPAPPTPAPLVRA
ncbi:MMPL family transporter [Hamadaea tsunoensis]|uniref:MMPL family transporter n=1 Tax=Hamadaea tsunoensis TaxID=53368 RepID=UPI000413E712|nr:MMPL family transporter [Hamadaea tsunoensis]